MSNKSLSVATLKDVQHALEAALKDIKLRRDSEARCGKLFVGSVDITISRRICNSTLDGVLDDSKCSIVFKNANGHDIDCACITVK